MLASKRGLGRDELRYAMPTFLEAVRWVAFVEQLGPELVNARRVAATDPPSGSTDLIEFNARRAAARRQVATLEPLLYPVDPETNA